MNVFRRLPLYRLLLLCGVAMAVGIGATALASALDSGPTPPEAPLAQAVHNALSGAAPEGFSANIQLTDHLLEGANLASEGTGPGGGGGGGGGLTSSPLVTGGSGRIWVAKNGEFRVELQSEQGDTELVYDGHTLELYDAAADTLYRYTPPAHEQHAEGEEAHQVPSLAKIEEAIAHLEKHVDLTGPTPTDVGGAPAYTVSASPKEGGSLLGSIQLAFDAENGVPLRAAVYAVGSSSPALELAASEVSFGPVESSVFELQPPSGVKVKEFKASAAKPAHATRRRRPRGQAPTVTVHGQGPGAIVVVETKAKRHSEESELLHGLPTVKIGRKKASELRTALGTILTFEHGGVRYLLAGSVQPSAVQALASGL